MYDAGGIVDVVREHRSSDGDPSDSVCGVWIELMYSATTTRDGHGAEPRVCPALPGHAQNPWPSSHADLDRETRWEFSCVQSEPGDVTTRASVAASRSRTDGPSTAPARAGCLAPSATQRQLGPGEVEEGIDGSNRDGALNHVFAKGDAAGRQAFIDLFSLPLPQNRDRIPLGENWQVNLFGVRKAEQNEVVEPITFLVCHRPAISRPAD